MQLSGKQRFWSSTILSTSRDNMHLCVQLFKWFGNFVFKRQFQDLKLFYSIKKIYLFERLARELPTNSCSNYFSKHLLNAWYCDKHWDTKWKSKHGLMTISVHIKIFINITHYLWWINNILSKVISYKKNKTAIFCLWFSRRC